MFKRDRFYRPPEAWKSAHVPRQMLYDALHSGELKAVKRGNRYLIPGGALVDWIDTAARGQA